MRESEPSTLTPERQEYARYLLTWSKNPTGTVMGYEEWQDWIQGPKPSEWDEWTKRKMLRGIKESNEA